MAESYGDVMKYISEPVPEVQKPTGLRGFLENWLGVMLLGTASVIWSMRSCRPGTTISNASRVYSEGSSIRNDCSRQQNWPGG